VIVVLATPFGRAAPAPAADEIVLGVLLSLTGDWSSLGNDSQAAIELAVDEVNRTLLAGSPTRLRAVVEDTRLQPDVALDRLRSLAAQGARIVIGPQSSAEVRALKPFADANGVLLVSQGSTASALAIPDDNIFRFVPDDSHEIDALVALLVADGIQTIVPMWRDDTGNQGLEASLRRTFPRAGGTVASGVSYPADRVQFAGALASLSAQVAQAVAERGPDAVGVYLAAFDEAASVLATAQRDPGLASVRWYGSDGAALSDALVSDPDAARFAVRAGYPNPTVGLDQQARPLAAGGQPDPRPHGDRPRPVWPRRL